jgi:hypothetical protein
MTVILLVRHGHVEGIKPECFRGARRPRGDRTGTKASRVSGSLDRVVAIGPKFDLY